MPRPEIARDVDLAALTAKRELQSEIGRLTGLYEVRIKPVKLTRSTQQNRYFHGCVVRQFQEFMRSQGQIFSHDQCYQYLRDRFIPRPPILDIETGEVIDYMPASTAALSPDEFTEFVEDVRNWLADTFNVNVPDPTPATERKGSTQTKQLQPPPMMN
jgi:hypothetical protein